MYGGVRPADSFYHLRLLQIVADSIAAVLIFLIAAQVLPIASATISGLLVALSPHLATYALWLTPESLAVLPILVAIYLIVRPRTNQSLKSMIVAGACIGLSCWLRSNAILLAPFVALMFCTLNARNRLVYSLAIIVSAAVVIAPITLRNWLLFDSFVPISLGAGITLTEGIADYDKAGRFGLAATDDQTRILDAEWHNNPEYAGNLWKPDGVFRDRARMNRGLEVILSNPGWFIGVMIDRAWSMLRYNDSFGHGRHYHIAAAPIVAREPAYGHKLSDLTPAGSVWVAGVGDLLTAGVSLSGHQREYIEDTSQWMEVVGDGSAYGDQFASAPIPLEQNTDYIFSIDAIGVRNGIAIRISDEARDKTLSPTVTLRPLFEADQREDGVGSELSSGDKTKTIQLPFASGNRTYARFVISNNLQGAGQPAALFGEASLFKVGATPFRWTRVPRLLVNGIQRYLFRTPTMLILITAGIILLVAAGRNGAVLLLVSVPLYYVLTQSFLHTEYRYITVIHYFLFTFAGVGISSIGMLAASLVTKKKRITPKDAEESRIERDGI
jgi:hypothetical protein